MPAAPLQDANPIHSYLPKIREVTDRQTPQFGLCDFGQQAGLASAFAEGLMSGTPICSSAVRKPNTPKIGAPCSRCRITAYLEPKRARRPNGALRGVSVL